jgi:hypothetical protein
MTTQQVRAKTGLRTYRGMSSTAFEWLITAVALIVLSARFIVSGPGPLGNATTALDVLFWAVVIGIVELLHVPVWKSIQVSMGVHPTPASGDVK